MYIDEPGFLEDCETTVIFDSVLIRPGVKEAIFDFSPKENEISSCERLYDLWEKELINRAFYPPGPIVTFLKYLGIDYPHCWIGFHILTKALIKNFHLDEPGDIDILAGNVLNNYLSLEPIIGIQIKVRKITLDDQLKSFPSGRGTKQSLGTTRMGFDKTLLLHFIIREPRNLEPGMASSWSPIHNADFFRAFKANLKHIKDDWDKNRFAFGYGLLGLGQIPGDAFQLRGGYSPCIAIPPPFKPFGDDKKVKEYRKTMVASLKNLLGGRCDRVPLFLRHCKKCNRIFRTDNLSKKQCHDCE